MRTTNHLAFSHVCAALMRPGTASELVVTQMVETLLTTPLAWREHLRLAIATVGKPALPPLLGMLAEDVPERREAAKAALATMGKENLDAIIAATSLLDGPDPAVRGAAVEVLGTPTMWATAAVEGLARALADGDATVRFAAIQALPRTLKWTLAATNALDRLAALARGAEGPEKMAAQAAGEAIAAALAGR
jgi:HEAT repeat protein